jgi:hypothetical protein
MPIAKYSANTTRLHPPSQAKSLPLMRRLHWPNWPEVLQEAGLPRRDAAFENAIAASKVRDNSGARVTT